MYAYEDKPIGTLKTLKFWSISTVNQVLVHKCNYKDTASLEIKIPWKYFTNNSLNIL